MLSKEHNTGKVVAALTSRVDHLAAAVSLLAEKSGRNAQYDGSDGGPQSGHEMDVSNPSSVLNYACDEGIFNHTVLALAESVLTTTNKFHKLSAIRAIALADRNRGHKIINEALAIETNKTIIGALKATLKAID